MICLRANNGKLSIFKLILLFITAVVALSGVLLLAIQITFSIDAPVKWLHPVWDANGLLGYLGALVGSISAIAVLYFSLRAGREDRRHSDVMSVLPCITLTRLSAKPLRLIKSSFAHTAFSEDNPKDDEYESGVLDCVDRLSISNGTPAVPCDTDPEPNQGVNRYAVSSVGAGPAVNVRVGIAKRNDSLHSDDQRIDWGQTRQLPVGGESELVVFFKGDSKPMSEVGYRILVTYSDILGNRYLQYFPMTFDEHDSALQSTVDNSINRISIS